MNISEELNLWWHGVCYCVYILASKKNGVLSVGMTNNLTRRLCEHKSRFNKGFSMRYSVYKLVYVEQSDDVRKVIEREKQIKKMAMAVENQSYQKIQSQMGRFVRHI